MIRLMTFSGLVAALALAAVLIAASSQSHVQAAQDQAARDNGNCRTVEVAADAGYGISGTVAQRVCE